MALNKVFASWCRSRGEDSVNCLVGLQCLRECFSAGAAPSTLFMLWRGCFLGKTYPHILVSRFLRGSRWLRPYHPTAFPPWDVLENFL